MTAFTVTCVAADTRQISACFGSHVSLMERADHYHHYCDHLMHAVRLRYVFLKAGCSQPWVMVYVLGKLDIGCCRAEKALIIRGKQTPKAKHRSLHSFSLSTNGIYKSLLQETGSSRKKPVPCLLKKYVGY